MNTDGDVGFLPMLINYSLTRQLYGQDCPPDVDTCGLFQREKEMGQQLSIEMLENTNNPGKTCSKLAYKFAREISYDMGAWAVAYMIHLSGKPEAKFWTDFWPTIGKVGYRKAIADYTQLDSLETFYSQFNKFIRQNDP